MDLSLVPQNDVAQVLARATQTVFDSFRRGAVLQGNFIGGPAFVVFQPEQSRLVWRKLFERFGSCGMMTAEFIAALCHVAVQDVAPMCKLLHKRGASLHTTPMVRGSAARNTNQPAPKSGLIIKWFDVAANPKVNLLNDIRGVAGGTEA